MRDSEIIREWFATGEHEPPCEPECSGYIRLGDAFGACPLIEEHPACVIPARREREMRDDLLRLGWPAKYVREAEWGRCPFETELRSWLSSGTSGLVLIGPVGTGKTMGLTLAAQHLWRERKPVRFLHWTDLVNMLARRPEGYAERLDKFRYTGLLAVDDFGVGDVPSWVVGTLDWLFEQRNGRELPTLVTTNLTVGTLAGMEWAKRIVDRWRENATVISVPGKSMRRQT